MAAYWALCKLIREHEGGTEIERSQESMIVRSLQRMTNSGVGLTDQLIADGGHARYDQIAEKAEVSESTVYRWLARMGDAVESDNGVITFHSIQLREQFQEIIGRTVTSVQNAVDQAVKAADDVLERDAYQRNPAGPIDSWKAKWGAEFSGTPTFFVSGLRFRPRPRHQLRLRRRRRRPQRPRRLRAKRRADRTATHAQVERHPRDQRRRHGATGTNTRSSATSSSRKAKRITSTTPSSGSRPGILGVRDATELCQGVETVADVGVTDDVGVGWVTARWPSTPSVPSMSS